MTGLAAARLGRFVCRQICANCLYWQQLAPPFCASREAGELFLWPNLNMGHATTDRGAQCCGLHWDVAWKTEGNLGFYRKYFAANFGKILVSTANTTQGHSSCLAQFQKVPLLCPFKDASFSVSDCKVQYHTP